MNYVATHEIDDRPVYDHKTGERLSPHLVKVGRQTEHDAMTRHQLFKRVPIAMARGKKVRCQWLDEMKEAANGPFVRSRLVAMEVAHGVRFDTFAGTALLKCIKIIISRAASIKNTRGGHSRVLALYDISVAFWHALLPEDGPTAMYPPRGEEEAGYMWQMKRAMYGTRRASRLFQDCLETDSMAAIHGDDIIAEGEPEKLDRLDEVLKQLVVVKVLDRVGPRAAETWTVPEETYRVHQRSEFRVAGRSEASCCDHQKPFQGRREATELTRKRGPWFKAIQKRWTSWKRWKESCISKIQASAFTCPVEDSTFSSV